MGRGLIRNTKITTGFAPLRTMSLNAPIAPSFVGDQMGQLMEHGPTYFVLGNLYQARIELNERAGPSRPARIRTHP